VLNDKKFKDRRLTKAGVVGKRDEAVNNSKRQDLKGEKEELGHLQVESKAWEVELGTRFALVFLAFLEIFFLTFCWHILGGLPASYPEIFPMSDFSLNCSF
jgi:hypothetical protein